jgi:hypothetical protein
MDGTAKRNPSRKVRCSAYMKYPAKLAQNDVKAYEIPLKIYRVMCTLAMGRFLFDVHYRCPKLSRDAASGSMTSAWKTDESESDKKIFLKLYNCQLEER